jgi:hypothetical protein
MKKAKALPYSRAFAFLEKDIFIACYFFGKGEQVLEYIS